MISICGQTNPDLRCRPRLRRREVRQTYQLSHTEGIIRMSTPKDKREAVAVPATQWTYQSGTDGLSK